MTGPRRSEGSGVRIPRMRPCAVEMTGTVCCANEVTGYRERERHRDERRHRNAKGDEEEGILLVLSSNMMVCLGVAGR